MIEKIKKWIKLILKMPLWLAILIGFCILSGYEMIRDIYHQFRYHFSDVLHTFYFWGCLIGGVLIISWGVYLIDYLRKNKK